MLDLIAQLGLTHPIIQSPMAGVSTPQLAAAVSNAGGLGSLGIGASTVAQAREAIEATRQLTSCPFNVNVFCHAPATPGSARDAAWIAALTPLFKQQSSEPPTQLREIYRSFLSDEESFQLLLDLKPAVVSFHFNVPPPAQVGALRAAGIITFASVTCVEEAAQATAAGVDVLVAQGHEAGGHRGMFDPDALDEELSMSVLVRQLVRDATRPVIAAGGIMDGQGIRAALDLGAVAAQLGTAFVLCPESAAAEGYRTAMKGRGNAHTRMTRALSGRPARGIVNPLIDYADTLIDADPADYPLAYDIAKQLFAAYAAQGRTDVGAFWAGQGAPMARELPAQALVSLLAEEMTR